jgi:hypothetical protein
MPGSPREECEESPQSGAKPGATNAREIPRLRRPTCSQERTRRKSRPTALGPAKPSGMQTTQMTVVGEGAFMSELKLRPPKAGGGFRPAPPRTPTATTSQDTIPRPLRLT